MMVFFHHRPGVPGSCSGTTDTTEPRFFRAQSSGLPTERQALSRLRIRGKEHVGYSGSPEARSARRLEFLASEKGSKAPDMEKRDKDRNDARKKHCLYIRGFSWIFIVNYCICIICIIMYLGLSKNGILLSAINQSFPHIAHFNCHLMGYIRYIPTTGIPIRGC